MTELWSRLKNTDKPIVLYGTGNGADKIIRRLERDNVRISGVFSSDGFKKNKVFAGHTVCDYATLKEKLGNMVILVAFGSDRTEVIDNIERLSKESELYVPDVPVYGEEIFDRDFAVSHIEKLKSVYDMLADDTSKQVFESIIRFKLSGRPEYLFGCESERNEDNEILSLGKNESFLDLGAFTGDTIEEFIGITGGIYKKITAVEPDSRNFKRLCKNTEVLKNISCINSAVNDSQGSIFISKQHGRGMSENAKTVEIPCTTIDALCTEMTPTYIKMDIEGAECAAVCGGEKTISAFRPKMRIACYHRSSDIFEIPLLVKKIVPDYKIFIRHNPCLPAWDTDYIFI